MSVMEKLGSIMARPNEDLVAKDDVSVWMKYAARGLGTVGGGIAIFLGMWCAIGIALGSVAAFFAGVWQMLAGFLTIVVEAPCCCMFLDFVGNLSTIVDNRPFWNRGALYVAISLPPIFICFSLSTIFGSGLIFGTGVLYGLMALGKKAPVEGMQSSAMASSTLVSGLKTSLTDSAQPMARSPPFTGGIDHV